MNWELVADAVYAFGMPRIGTPDFAAKYNGKLGDRTYRLVHGDDIVPTVPPTKFGFCHVGRSVICRGHALFAPDALSAQPTDSPPFVETWMSGQRVVDTTVLSAPWPAAGRPLPDHTSIAPAASRIFRSSSGPILESLETAMKLQQRKPCKRHHAIAKAAIQWSARG